jgi:hypothetical protein
MAHGGQPQAALASGQALTEISGQLTEVANSLKAPLNQLLEVSWQGQAADAAKAGIGQHAAWAENVATEITAMAGEADQYHASAMSTISKMDGLMQQWQQLEQAKAAAAAAGPTGAANVAAIEEMEQELQLQALQAFQQHAATCTSITPKGAVTAPPTAGSGGKGAAVAEEAGEGAGKSVDKNAGATSEGGTVAEEPAGRTTSASAVEGPNGVGEGAPGEAGGRPDSVSGYEPGAGGMVRAGGGYLPQTRTQRNGYAPANGASDDGLPGGSGSSRYGGDGFADEAMPVGGVLGAGGGETYRPSKPTSPPPRTRTVTQAPDGYSDGYDDGALSGQGDGQGQQGQQQGMSGGGMMSPGMMGGGAMAGGGQGQQGQRHDSPEYLLDEDDLFNGEDWVAPPVIRQ